MYDDAAQWSKLAGDNPAPWVEGAKELGQFIRTHFWNPQSGFFYDRWGRSHDDPPLGIMPRGGAGESE